MKLLIFCLFIASNSKAEVQATRSGPGHPVTAADGLLLKGDEAEILFHSLNAPVRTYQEGFFDKVVVLSQGTYFPTQVVNCYKTPSIDRIECYIGATGNK